MNREIEIEKELENFGLKDKGEYSKVLAQLTKEDSQEDIVCYLLLDEGFVFFPQMDKESLTPKVPQVIPFFFVKNLTYKDGFFSLKLDFVHEENTYHLTIPHRKMNAKWQYGEYKKFLSLLAQAKTKKVSV